MTIKVLGNSDERRIIETFIFCAVTREFRDVSRIIHTQRTRCDVNRKRERDGDGKREGERKLATVCSTCST